MSVTEIGHVYGGANRYQNSPLILKSVCTSVHVTYLCYSQVFRLPPRTVEVQLKTLFQMFKKVNARERIVGWYHTGPRLKANDMAIHELIQKSMPQGHDATLGQFLSAFFTGNNRDYMYFLVVIDVSTDRQDSGLPTEAYVAVDTVREDGKPVEKTWKHLASGIGAEEAEEVGVEQLLRDVHNPTAGSLR